jgi:hypothetical protein
MTKSASASTLSISTANISLIKNSMLLDIGIQIRVDFFLYSLRFFMTFGVNATQHYWMVKNRWTNLKIIHTFSAFNIFLEISLASLNVALLFPQQQYGNKSINVFYCFVGHCPLRACFIASKCFINWQDTFGDDKLLMILAILVDQTP